MNITQPHIFPLPTNLHFSSSPFEVNSLLPRLKIPNTLVPNLKECALHFQLNVRASPFDPTPNNTSDSTRVSIYYLHLPHIRHSPSISPVIFWPVALSACYRWFIPLFFQRVLLSLTEFFHAFVSLLPCPVQHLSHKILPYSVDICNWLEKEPWEQDKWP